MRPQSPPPLWHTSSKKVTPIPTRPHLLIVSLPLGPFSFKPQHYVILHTHACTCYDIIYYNFSQLWSLPGDNIQIFCLEIGGKENWLWGQPGSHSQVLSPKTGSEDLIIGYNLVVECRHSICKALESITQSIDQNKALSIKHFIIVVRNGPLQTYF